MPIFNYNISLSNVKTFDEYLKKCVRSSLTPSPVYVMRTHWPRPPLPPPCVRTLWMTPKANNVRPPHGLAVYIRNCHRRVSSEKLSTDQFEALIVNVFSYRSKDLYTVIVVYKAPSCSFEQFKASLRTLSHSVIGDFNFNVSRHMNRNFVFAMKSVFPRVKMLDTVWTIREKTILDVCFTTCNQAKANIIACVWSYHHTLVLTL